ncbi:tRNA (adenine(58)-N(1))-methyltransferase non-catalytic subunit TRM6 [Acropora cervicornis]|uniref:tRNA (adenine(58)-N(1))-methyltransferase non-catalytic subunit TRM6 n=1 Tax=Acropora cervicornis TaxID=6130 RepID=A0AAD9QIM0_ACRCE|nr:tRNA (adenine(58)-N(1))-methyltransferase non-catalytic subunit TRM6 [Acropora cervicornis]
MISEGEYVILKKENVIKAVEVRKGRREVFEKQHFSLDNAIGCPLGSLFEVKGSKLCPLEVDEDIDDLLIARDNTEEDKSNQFLQNDGASQKLSRDEIMDLKAQGVSGKDIVEHLVENSSTFKDRTQFSQAKYKKKKMNKHVLRFSILKPTSDLIAQMYYLRGDLRLDSLSQILTLSNVRAGCRTIVVESCQGMVAGALLERMGGHGSLVQIYSGDFPGRQALDYFNFPKRFMDCLCGFPMDKVSTLGQNTDAELNSKLANDVSNGTEQSATTPSETPESNNNSEQEEGTGNSLTDEVHLVIVSRFQPSPIVESLLPRLAPSRPFAVFCQYKAPLMECYVNLREMGTAINIRLTETWWRHYQVLPARTHPEINMNGSGGYLLSGITVDPSETPQNTGTPIPTKKPKLDDNAEDELCQ